MNNKEESGNTRAFLYYALLFIIPATILLTIAHEFGHIIAGLLLGETPIDVTINILQTPLLETSGGVNFENYQNGIFSEYIIAISGSMFTLMIGFMFLSKYFHNHKSNLKKGFYFISCLTFMFESLSYIILDSFFVKEGDWFKANQIIPGTAIIFLILLSINLFFVTRALNKSIQFNSIVFLYNNNEILEEIEDRKDNEGEFIITFDDLTKKAELYPETFILPN